VIRRMNRFRRWAMVGVAAVLPVQAATGPYVTGQTYFGRNGYIEFTAGDLPIIVSAPHGGAIEPAEIPNRTSGDTATDSGTEDLSRAVAAALRARTGRQASLIICRLRRTKLDVNRDIGEAAQGNADATQAWREYHAFIEAARDLVLARRGRGLVIDLHGHSHRVTRTELGYLLTANDLNRSDTELDRAALASRTSIRALAGGSAVAFSALLRGPSSLGGLLQRAGYASVPSPGTPGPGSDPYFNGGYTTARHGSRNGGSVDAVQIELPFRSVRESATARSRFAAALADALVTYLSTHARVPI
jgi:N-formylglutamate amidohydrolase